MKKRMMLCLVLVLLTMTVAVAGAEAAAADVFLTWGASTDNVAVAYYEVFHATSLPSGSAPFTQKIGQVTHPETSFLHIAPGPGPHCYTVVAVDTSENRSGEAAPKCVLIDVTPPSVPTVLQVIWQ